MSTQIAGAPRQSPRYRRWGWRTWSVLIAAVAWLVFVVLHLLLSGRVWWWGLPELLPPMAFLVIPLALLVMAMLARPARGWVLVGAAASIVLGWEVSGFNPSTLWHRTEPVPAGAVTVFSWNTWYWDQRAADGARGPTSAGTPSADTADFYQYLREQDADVYLLQEYVYFPDEGEHPIRVDGLDRLRREFPGYHVATTGELLTLSRFPIVRERSLDLRPWLSAGTADHVVPPGSDFPEYFTNKTLRTDIRIDEHLVSFYNSHVNTPVDPSASGADPRRISRHQHNLRQANFHALAADIEANPRPVVLAGDLNTSPAMGLLNLLPDRLTAPDALLGTIYPTSWNDVRLPLWRVDWIFTADVTVYRYQLVRSGGLSDHAGQRLVMT